MKKAVDDNTRQLIDEAIQIGNFKTIPTGKRMIRHRGYWEPYETARRMMYRETKKADNKRFPAYTNLSNPYND